MKQKYKQYFVEHTKITDAGYAMDNINFFLNNKKIGYIAYNKKYIEALFIFPEYRGKGYANDMMDYAVNELNLNELTVDVNNYKAISLYKKFGFKIKEKTKDHSIPVYNMEK